MMILKCIAIVLCLAGAIPALVGLIIVNIDPSRDDLPAAKEEKQ